MDQLSRLVEGYSSTFEQCLLAKDPVAHAKSLPDTVEKKLLLFLLEPHSDKYKEELRTKYNIRGELLENIDKWKVHSKITKANNPEEIKYLIETFIKANKNSFNYPKPAQFQSGTDQNKAEEYTLPSKLKPIKSLQEWAQQELNRNEDIITTLSKKAIRAINKDRLLKLKVVNKQRLLSMPGLLVQYQDGFVVQFIQNFYDQMLKTNKNYEIPNFVYYNISKNQFMNLKLAIPGIINKDQYLRVWFSHSYDEELQKFQKGDLTISQKDEKRNVLLKILKDLQSFKTIRTKSMQRNILRQILKLDISRDEADKKLFLQYLKDNPVSSSYEKQKVRQQKYQKYHSKAQYADMDINLGLESSSTGEDQIIKETIERLFKKADAEDILKQLEEYFETSKLNKIYATVKLAEGGKIDDYINYLSAAELTSLRETRQITILDSNKKKWRAEEQVQLKVRVKNISDIHVQVYRIDLERHFVENNREIDQTQSLSYLQPNHSYHYAADNKNPYLVQIYDIKIQGIPASRGVWIVELEGEGISSRAFIRKGAIVNINSTNTAGTQLKYYDENGTQITDFHIWMDGKKHAVKSSFTVPYGQTDKSISLIVTKDGYAQRFQVYVPRESYSLDIAYLYNTQSFIVGSIARVLLHPQLMLNFDRNMQVSFKLLQKVKILVTLTNNLGIKSTIDFDNVQFKSTEDYLLQFPIQSYTRSIDISVSAKIKKYNKKDQDLTSAHSIQIQLSQNNMNFIDVYMKKNKDQYCVFVLGKNGEPIPRTEVVIQYAAVGRYSDDSQNLMTTKEGCVFVGDLKGISKVSARVNLKSGVISRSWNLQQFDSQIDLVQNAIYRQGQQIVFPLVGKQKIQLWKVTNSGSYAENLTDKINFDQSKISIKGLTIGRYDLDFLQSDRKVSFTVVKGKTWQTDNKIYDENIGQLYEIDPEQNHHLLLGQAKFTKEGENVTIEIPIRGTYDLKKDNTLRAHLMATNFVIPNFRGKFDLNNLRGSRQVKYQSFATKQSEFYNNKKLSEETSYVVNRGKQKKYIGNNLEKPKIFLKRIQVRDTTQLDQVLQNQGAYQQRQSLRKANDMMYRAEKCAPYGGRMGGKVHGSYSAAQAFVNPQDLTTHNNFLSLPGTIVSNQKGDTLVFKLLQGYSHFECYLFSKLTAIVKKFEFPVDNVQKKSLSHTGIEENTKDSAWTMSREVYKAKKGQNIKVGRDSVWSAIGLSNVAGFAKIKGAKLEDWVTNWNTYSEQEKLATYDEKVCHELNTYVKYNDKNFFEKIVLPFIKNKVTKTFVDLCLLENQQALNWASLDKFQTLNEFQKVLLVHQLVKAGRKQQAKSIVNTMENINKSERVTFEQFKQQFDTVITAKLTQEAQKAPQSRSSAPKNMMAKKKRAKQMEEAPQMRMMAMDMMVQSKAFVQCEQAQMCQDDDFGGGGGDFEDRSRFVQPFKQMQKTKQYTQTTYSGLKYPHQSQNLVKTSPFWTSVAQHFVQGNGDFLSQNFMYLTTTVQFTLATCFIPNQKLLQFGLKNQQDNVLIQPSSSFLIFVREVKSLPFQKKFGVLLNQRFFNPDDRFYYEEDGTKIEKQTEQFIARRPYCVQTLITNTSGTKLQLQLLIDIPEGSVPLQSHQTTQIQSINLEPYSTLSFERYFYFPSVGSYTIYPANACRSGLVIAKADQIKKIDVLQVETIKKMDTLQNVLKSGQKQGILQYLQTKNIFDSKIFDPASILWMLKDKQFYTKVVDILRSRKFYLSQIWIFGYFHNDLKAIAQYEKTENIQNYENVFKNLSIFEYFPYYSSRAHKFLNQNKSTIRNEQFKKTYFCFLFASLFNEPTSARARVAFIYYLLLQDRIDEAYNVLSQLDQNEKTDHQLQFDYIECFIDMYKGYPSFSKSRKIAQKYVDYPVATWQKMFKEITDTLKQYDSEEIVEEQKKVQFSTTVVNEGQQLRINVPPQTTVQVFLYDINLQLYFSTFPFTEVQTFSANTVPNTIQVYNAGESREEKFARKTEMKDCFVEVYSSTSGLKKKKVSSFLWSNPDIKIKVKEESGYAQVFYKNKKQAGCYCKVYQMKNGQSKFYRDGYTDITGTFKYALSDLDGVSQFSVLFVTDNGGVVERVKPPSQQAFLA